jgi:hypothetical protein
MPRRTRRVPSLGLSFLFFCATLPTYSQTSILGFTPAGAARETEIESKFKAIPSPDEERRQHHIFTAEPHVAGSERNNELARYIADQWRHEGLEDVIIRRYDVYGSNPKSTFLEMVAPGHYRAGLRELPVPGDSDLKNKAISSAWSGMSASGEVTAPAGLRAQRQSRGLPTAPPTGHRRQRQSGVGAVFEPLQLSGIQSAHCAARRCGRDSHLQRSRRRWI